MKARRVMKRIYQKLYLYLEGSSTNSSREWTQSQGQMSRTSPLTLTDLMTPAEDQSLKRREIKAEEFNAMVVKDMGIFELNVLPFSRNKRKE